MDRSKPCKHLLVTPVYQDAARLARFGSSLAQALATAGLDLRWVLADDGSGSEEVRRLEGLVADWRALYAEIDLLPHERHLGKGGAVRAAWDAYPEAEWLSFCDADGSFRADDITALLRHAEARGPGTAVLASRRLANAEQVRSSLRRKLAHHAFAELARRLLSLPVGDPQCGAKAIPGPAYRRLRSRLKENGFTFDCELIATLQEAGTEFEEFPVAWTEKSGSRLSLLRDGPVMLARLLRLALRR